MSRREGSPGNPAAFSRIWSVVSRIPRGRVATYGQVARMAGLSRGARTAGWALHALPDGLRIDGRPVPWHRVINAGGRISPRGGDGESLAVVSQGSRLRREGIRVTEHGMIDLDLYGWSGDTGRTSRRRGRSSGARTSK
jgi:methylated-DNA-protein-cysteine methyltransferase-like protein